VSDLRCRVTVVGTKKQADAQASWEVALYTPAVSNQWNVFEYIDIATGPATAPAT
jgi:patatin-like phospholipase/acyl hydrolase